MKSAREINFQGYFIFSHENSNRFSLLFSRFERGLYFDSTNRFSIIVLCYILWNFFYLKYVIKKNVVNVNTLSIYHYINCW